MLDLVEVKETVTAVKSVSVLRAMINATSVKESDLFDYATRVGEEEVYLFNLLASSIDRTELEDMLIGIINKAKADLTLVEIVGSPNDTFNNRIIKNCDAVLNIFNANQTSINAVIDYVENYDKGVVLRTGYICQKYDADAASEKKLSALVKMNARNLMAVPYNSVVIKESLDGTLNTLAKYIAQGHNEVVNLRPKLLEIMQFLFDSPKFKYIKGVNQWHK